MKSCQMQHDFAGIVFTRQRKLLEILNQNNKECWIWFVSKIKILTILQMNESDREVNFISII